MLSTRCRHASLSLALAISISVPGFAPPAAGQTITEFVLPATGSEPGFIINGPDGALWFSETSGNKIGRITISGKITEFPIPTRKSGPAGLAVGSDGAIWLTERAAGKIGRITTSGTITEFFVPAIGAGPALITAGPDGALWFTELFGNKIGRITTTGSVREFNIPAAARGPVAIATASDGNIWFTESNKNKIGKITPFGFITKYPNPDTAVAIDYLSPSPDGRLYFSVVGIGPDGALWLLELVANKIERVGASASGTPNYTEFAIPTPAAGALALIGGPDCNNWFTETKISKIGRLTVRASRTPLVAAVLPSSRSIQVGHTATAFATIINGGASALTNCRILPLTTVPGHFSDQTTDPSTNAAIGSPNTPVALNAGASQSFYTSYQANAAVSPTDVVPSFDCKNVDPAVPVTGLNTLLLSSSYVATPDVIALSAMPSGDGILDIAGTSGSNAFAVATANVGAAGSVNASVDTGSATIPVTLKICPTNPSTAACLGTPSATPTRRRLSRFSRRGQGRFHSRRRPPASSWVSRMAGGAICGSTSVAIRTQ
ncbi:MAG: lyase-like protein [Rhodospirillales bacterium]|nr:lyase-like protein [Rhodospirillales bacterium]